MRTQTKVNRSLFEKALSLSEANGPLKNYSELGKTVSEKYNELVKANPQLDEFKPITSSIVLLRLAFWKITPKTQKGKRGRTTGFGPPSGPRKPRKSRAEKMASNPKIQLSLKVLEKQVPEKYQSLFQKFINGSRNAKDKLHCLKCSAWQPYWVKNCHITACFNWPSRPYQGKLDESESKELADSTVETPSNPEAEEIIV